METLPTDQAMKIAEEILGAIRWVREGVGYCPCPGEGLHSAGKSQKKDCRVTVVPGRMSDAPTIYCFHSHCAEVVDATNFKLRSAIGKAKARASGGVKDLNRGHPAGTKKPVSGGQGGAGQAPSTSGSGQRVDEIRTVRTGFLNSTPAEAAPIDAGRTLRTDFLHKFSICAQAHTHSEGGSEKNPSEVSGPVKVDPAKEPPPRIEAPAEDDPPDHTVDVIAWKPARLEPGHDFRTRYTRWVGSDGSVHHAHVSEGDQGRVIKIGRKMGTLGGVE